MLKFIVELNLATSSTRVLIWMISIFNRWNMVEKFHFSHGKREQDTNRMWTFNIFLLLSEN